MWSREEIHLCFNLQVCVQAIIVLSGSTPTEVTWVVPNTSHCWVAHEAGIGIVTHCCIFYNHSTLAVSSVQRLHSGKKKFWEELNIRLNSINCRWPSSAHPFSDLSPTRLIVTLDALTTLGFVQFWSQDVLIAHPPFALYLPQLLCFWTLIIALFLSRYWGSRRFVSLSVGRGNRFSLPDIIPGPNC
jgi:hypothetical protein